MKPNAAAASAAGDEAGDAPRALRTDEISEEEGKNTHIENMDLYKYTY